MTTGKSELPRPAGTRAVSVCILARRALGWGL
jgi:hypothetical protein